MSGSNDSVYTPSATQQSAQNTNATNLLTQNANSISGYAPAVQQQATDLTNSYIANPYQPAAQAGAGTAGAYATGTVAPTQAADASSLQALGGQNAGYSQQALATGFDPQNALYNQQSQQSQDQQNAINVQNGLTGPYAAGVSGQTQQNFNTNWLNQELGRQSTAAGTASTLSGTANTDYTGASNLGTAAVNTETQGSALPASTYATNISNDLSALQGQNTATAGASAISNVDIQSILAYLGYGQSASTNAAQEQQTEFGGLGSLAGLGLSFL